MQTIFEQFSAFNAGCIEEAVMPLEDQGLVLIRGENHDEGDSNGSGKTTLFELFAHTLFGKTSKGGSKNALLNLKDPTNYHTQASFRRDNGSRYLVDQYRKHSKHGTGVQIHIDGSAKDMAPDGYNPAQNKVKDYVGLLWREFQGQVYLSQKYTHTMLEGTPSDKQKYLSHYFGLDLIDSLIEEGSKRINAIPLPDQTHLMDMLEHVQGELKLLGNVEDMRKSLRDAREKQVTLQKKILDSSVNLDKQLKAQIVAEERKKWESNLSRLDLTLDSGCLKEALSSLRSKSAELRARIKAFSSYEELTKNLKSLGVDSDSSYEVVACEVEKLAEEVGKLERTLPKVERRENLESRLMALGDVSDDPGQIQERLSTRQKTHRKLSNKVAVLVSEISSLEDIEDVCPTCSRPMDEHERQDMLEGKKERYSSLSEKAARAARSIASLESRLSVAATKSKLEESLSGLPAGDAEKLRTRLVYATTERKRLSKLANSLVKAAAIHERLADLTVPDESESEINVKLGKVGKRISRLESAYDFSLAHGDVEFDVQELQRLQDTLGHYEVELESLNDALLSSQDSVTKWESFTKQVKDLESSMNSHSTEKNRHQALNYVTFTLKELKKLGLRESTELLTDVLPLYLSQLFPQGEIRLRVTDKADGFDLLFEKGGQSIPLSSISGGQAKRVGIAIIFAFAKMGKRTTNLLIADEPFIHLDRRGRAACYDLLRDLDMGTILMTAHDQDLQATRRYDQIWTVKMKNHRSRLYLDG